MKTRINVSQKKIFIAASRTLIILSILIAATAFSFLGKGSIVAHAQTKASDGTWTTLTGQIPAPGGGSPCPSTATIYTDPTLIAYNCHEILYDGSLHQVWIREGRTGASGFGIAHFGEHNLQLHVVEDVIDGSQQGFPQSNSTRYEYDAGYRDPNTQQVTQYVVVVEERAKPSDPGTSSDPNELGILTAFCQGPNRSYEQLCPDWVNATL